MVIVDLDAPKARRGGPSEWVIGAWARGLLGLHLCTTTEDDAYPIDKGAVEDFARRAATECGVEVKETVWLNGKGILLYRLLSAAMGRQELRLRNGVGVRCYPLSSSKRLRQAYLDCEKSIRWRPLPSSSADEYYVFQFDLKSRVHVIVYNANLFSALNLLQAGQVKHFFEYAHTIIYHGRVIERESAQFNAMQDAVRNNVRPEIAVLVTLQAKKR
jgi:hypothetical protein